MTIRDEIDVLRKKRRRVLTQAFKAWVRERFGRDLRPGDKLRRKDDGYVYTVIKYGWDYNFPCIQSQAITEYPLGKTILKQVELIS